MDEVSEQFEIDRRLLDRPTHSEPKGTLFYRLMIDNIGKAVFESKILLVLYIAIILLFTGSIYWSLTSRLPQISSNQILLEQRNQIQREFAELQKKLSPKELRQIEKNIVQAEKNIFDSFLSLANWLNEKNNYAKSLGLTMKYQLRPVSTTDISKTFSLPIEIKVSTDTKNRKNSYLKIMEFTRSIINENRHVEVLATHVISDGKGITLFSLDINLWIKDPTLILSETQKSQQKEKTEGADVPFLQ